MGETYRCLACGQDMTVQEWYPEMLCEPCRRDIDMAVQEQNGVIE